MVKKIFLYLAIILMAILVLVYMELFNESGKTVDDKPLKESSEKEEEIKVKGNLWIKSTYDDFKKGNFEGTILAKEENGEIKIEQVNGNYKNQGVYTSEKIDTEPFRYMVLSWNSETPENTSIKLEVQALVNKGDKQTWSSWLSYGTWSTSAERASEKESSDDLAFVDTDILTIKGDGGENASAVKFRITLNTSNTKNTPVVKLVSGTLRNDLEGKEIPNEYPGNEGVQALASLDKTLDVPTFSQSIRDPKISNSICSPTSMAMILNYHGVKILPEESAWGVYDKLYNGFGNWPFNTAFVSSFGFDSYVTYNTSLDDLKREILKGNPVAISVKYRNSEKVNKPALPIVHGAPINFTNGHLIVVCGFTEIEEREYVIVNDPSASKDKGVRVKYLASELDEAWKVSGRVAYLVHKTDIINKEPKRLDAEFNEIKSVSSNGAEYMEFELNEGNEAIDLSKANALTIMASKDGGSYTYVTPGSNKNLLFSKAQKNGKYEYLVIARGNKVYKATINWNKK